MDFTVFYISAFTAQFAPPSFGMGGMADDQSARIVDIVYYSMYWFAIAEIYYIGGYVTHKYGISVSGIIVKLKGPRIYKQVAAISFIVIIVMPIMVLDNNWYYGGKFTATNAVYSIVMGEAKEFSDEWHERIDVLTDPNEKSVVFKPLKAHPKLLFYSDMDADSDYEWSNLPMRCYYDKDYLSVQYE